MKRIINIVAVATVVVLAASCAQKSESFEFQSAEAIISEFPALTLVPQDAPAVFCLGKCAEGLDRVYCKAPFDSLDLGAFSGSRAVLSFFYDGRLFPCLYIDCGETPDGSRVDSLASLVASRGIKTKLLEKDGCSAILLTVSDYAIAAQEYSMAAGKSVLDAAGFSEALSNAPMSQGVTMFFSNKESAKLPAKFLSGEFERQRLRTFIARFASWTVISYAGDTLYDIMPVAGDDIFYGANMFRDMKAETSCISSILPRSTLFVLDLPLSSWKKWRQAYGGWLDSQTKMPAYRRRMSDVKAATGKDPYEWEKMLNPREIAFVHFGKHKLVAIRSGSRFNPHDPAPNPYRDCLPAVFGNAFQLLDDSFYASTGKWILIGSEDGVKSFLASDKKQMLPAFDGKKIKYGVFRAGTSLWSEGNKTFLNFDR